MRLVHHRIEHDKSAMVSSMPPSLSNLTPRRQTVLVCALLLLAVAAVFGQTVGNGFTFLDDEVYIFENYQVLRGLRWENIVWAFTTDLGQVWIPTTWLSLMLDAQFWGARPVGYHLTNVLLHGASVVCLFLAFRRMTGELWPSAFVAAVFAIHPLQVESVAWATERKDVLSGLFFVLTLWAYASYAEQPRSWPRYLAVLAFAALGMMAKAMLVTLPLVLLLLDYWPLNRFSAVPVANNRFARFGRCAILLRLVGEKIPLFAMTVAVAVITYHIQTSKSLVSFERSSMLWRIGNAFLSYATYLEHFFCPMNLSPVYPRLSHNLPRGAVFIAYMLVLGITLAVFIKRRRFPYLLIGWFWFLGILIPVIGFVQVGATSIADRFTYLSIIGVAMMLTWGVSEVLKSSAHQRELGIAFSIAILTPLLFCAFGQAMLWHDGEVLWRHALQCTSRNHLAHFVLAEELVAKGRIDEALVQYREAEKLAPNYPMRNFGVALAMQGKHEEGIQYYLKVLKVAPDAFRAHFNLAWIYAIAGRRDEAIASYRRAIELETEDRDARNNLGAVLLDDSQYAEAVKEFQEAIRIGGDDPNVNFNLGNALLGLGRRDEAIEQYRKVLVASPDDAEAKKKIAEAEKKP